MDQQIQFSFSKFYSMNEQEDPLMQKLRTTLFEIRRKGFGKRKSKPSEGPLLGVTLMTKKYKSKRRLDPNQTQRSTRQNDQNSLKTQIFRRIVVSQPKKSNGLDIQKAVIHQTEPKKQRISTQKSSEMTEQMTCKSFSKQYLYKRLSKNRRPLNSHRDSNHQELRTTYFKAPPRMIKSERPCSAYTQPFLRPANIQEKTKSMQMQFASKVARNDEIEGWNVQNQEEFDFI